MDILLDGLPSTVDINGRPVRINTDYRAGIRFESIINDCRKDNRQKLEEALGLYFDMSGLYADDIEPAVDQLLWFYRCGKEAAACGDNDPDGARNAERSFDFHHDAGYVYAAFIQAYGIDLIHENIHWWQFRALFDSLPDDVQLVRIIGYRIAEVPAKATAEERQRIEKLKRAYALPLDADQAQMQTDLEAILMNGGNPAALLEGGAANGIRRNT